MLYQVDGYRIIVKISLLLPHIKLFENKHRGLELVSLILHNFEEKFFFCYVLYQIAFNL